MAPTTRLLLAALFASSAGLWQTKAPELVVCQGAGMPWINGEWNRIEDLNGAPQYMRAHPAINGTRYELFLHQDSSGDAAWNIQELYVDPNSKRIIEYGPVLYGAAMGSRSNTNKHVKKNKNTQVSPMLPRHGWSTHGGHWTGTSPAPEVITWETSSSVEDCQTGDDACIMYYLRPRLEDDLTNPHVPVRDRMCQDQSDWIRDFTAEELSALRVQFLETGIISLPAFLRWDVFERMQAAAHAPVHSEVWQASFPREDGRAHTISWHKDNVEDIAQHLQQQHQNRQDGIYAYSFTRTVDDCPSQVRFLYPDLFSNVRDLLESRKFQALLSAVTQRNYELHVLFVTRYTSGDFLNKHSDSVASRKLAFTLHLTKEWKLEYGGLLHFLDQNDWNKVIRTAVPRPNAFTLFDVSEERRTLPHYVTEVAQGLKRARIAITGWMSYKDDSTPLIFGHDEQWPID